MQLRSSLLHGFGVRHILNDSVHNIDAALSHLKAVDIPFTDVYMAYCPTGCDFCQSFFRIIHQVIIEELKHFRLHVERMS